MAVVDFPNARMSLGHDQWTSSVLDAATLIWLSVQAKGKNTWSVPSSHAGTKKITRAILE